MRADEIRFEDLFQIDVRSGRIHDGTNRYIVLSADSIGNMRQELINKWGAAVARGILERLGYRCGRNNARKLRERYCWPSDEQWMEAGLRLQRLEGVAEARLDSVAIDRDGRKFRVTGDWVNSFEAEQHLKSIGPGPFPVCWTLAGYGSGFATEIFGEEAVCVETLCRGKGDPVCSFEICPAAGSTTPARHLLRGLSATRMPQPFDGCLRSITDMGCELEQTSLDCIVTTDAEGFITSCSRGACEMLGLLPGEAIGKPVTSLYSGAGESRQVMDRVRSEGRIHHYITNLVAAAGRRIPVALSVSAVRDDAGRVVGTITVAHDLTEVRRLEDELAAKNRFMANILQDSADAIITLDPDDNITSWNRGAESIFGYSSAEIVGKSMTVLVPPDLREQQELAGIREKILAQGAVRSFQTERLTKDGRRIQVLFTRTAIRDDSGGIVGQSAVLKDVTFFRNLEKQLADAEHLATLGELSAGLAHEIKNPLAGIKGAIDVIRDSMDPDNEHREILGDVLHQVSRVDKIVRDLLNYAKPKPPSHSAINLPELVQRIVAMMRPPSKSEAPSIQIRQMSEIPGFTGDETQLEQVVVNLLLNAQNAVPTGGRIEVRLGYDREASAERVEVEDNGPGVPEDVRKKIFQPFFTTRTDGTGLGLATCLRNVQYHGGAVDVRSEAGRGRSSWSRYPCSAAFDEYLNDAQRDYSGGRR